MDNKLAIGDCPYVSLRDFEWKDVSCNVFVWDVHIPWCVNYSQFVFDHEQLAEVAAHIRAEV